MRFAGIAAAAILSLPRIASAQTVGEILVNDWRDAGKDVLSVWASPFDAKGRDWALFGGALALTGAAMLVDQEVSDWAIENKNSSGFRALDPIRRGGVLFSGKYVVPPIAAAYIAGVAFNNQDLRDFVTGCASSWAANSFARKAVYRLVGRARPDTMPDDPQHWVGPGKNDWMMRSFPAGHVANAMACVSYWNNRFRLGAAEPVLYAVAAAVGVGRFADEAHWISDTVLGGIFGYAVGREVARRSLKRQATRSAASGNQIITSPSSSFSISPDLGGLNLQLRWTF